MHPNLSQEEKDLNYSRLKYLLRHCTQDQFKAIKNECSDYSVGLTSIYKTLDEGMSAQLVRNIEDLDKLKAAIDNKSELINWNDVAKSAGPHPSSLELLIEAHKEINNLKDVLRAIKYCSSFSEFIQLVFTAIWMVITSIFYTKPIIDITNWDDEVAKAASQSPKSLALLIEEHKDKSSKIEIKNWDEVVMEAKSCPEALELLKAAYKASEIKVTNPAALEILKKPKNRSSEIIVTNNGNDISADNKSRLVSETSSQELGY